jgi:hypothetical protein
MKKTNVALVAAGLLALAGGGTALAGKGKGTTNTTKQTLRAHDMHVPGDDLAAAASYLGTTTASLMTQLQSGKTLAQIAGATSGKSVAGLVSALVAAEKTELAAAVTAGKLTQSQADTITPTLQQRFTDFANGVRPAGGPPGGGHDGVGPSDDLAAAASYLGTTTASLMTQLQSGKSLAQIAGATSGKSVAGLVSALVAAEKTELAAAVTAGKLTQSQADTIASTLQQRFTDFVNGVHPAGGPPGGGPGHGPDHGQGPGLDAAASYLGISQTSLFTQLKSGKTLAQIANATSGKSAAGLIAALVADAKQHFGTNVPSDLTQRITDLVSGVRPAGGPPGGPDHGFPHPSGPNA